MIDRYGIPPELIPDFYGLKGDTSDNIPGVPGIGDKTAAELLQRFGSLEEVLAHIDEISGAKRKENLTDARRRRARLQAAGDDPARRRRSTSTRRPRPRASPTARACARSSASSSCATRCARLEEALGEGDDGAAPAPVGRGHGRARGCARASLADVAGFERGERGRRRGRRARDARGRSSFADATPTGASASAARRGRARRRLRRAPRSSSPRSASARSSRTTPRRSGVVPPGLAHDTLLAAYLLEPARRGFPFRELCEERGLATDVDDPAGADAVVAAGARRLAARAARRARPRAADGRDRAAARRACCATWRSPACASNRERLAEIDERVRDEIHGLEREIWDAGRRGVRRSARPSSSGAILFEKLGLSRKRRGKTGFSTDARVLQAIRDEHEIIPKIERWRELNQLAQDLPRRAARS